MVSVVVLLAVFVMTLGNVTIHATVGLFGRSIGLSEFQVGIIIASSALLFALTSSRWGRFADERGRRPVILSGLAGAAVPLLLFGSLFTLKNGDVDVFVAFLALLGARTVHGFLCGGVQPRSYCLHGGHHEPSRSGGRCGRSRRRLRSGDGGRSRAGGTPGRAWLCRGASGGLFLDGADHHRCPLVSCVICHPRLRRTRRRRRRAQAGITPYLALAFVFHFAFAGLQATNAFYVQDTLKVDTIEAVQQASLVSLTFATSSFVFQAFVVRLLKWSPGKLMSTGLVVCGVTSVACLMAPDFGWLMLSFGMMGIGFAATQSGLTAGASLASSGNRQ